MRPVSRTLSHRSLCEPLRAPRKDGPINGSRKVFASQRRGERGEINDSHVGHVELVGRNLWFYFQPTCPYNAYMVAKNEEFAKSAASSRLATLWDARDHNRTTVSGLSATTSMKPPSPAGTATINPSRRDLNACELRGSMVDYSRKD